MGSCQITKNWIVDRVTVRLIAFKKQEGSDNLDREKNLNNGLTGFSSSVKKVEESNMNFIKKLQKENKELKETVGRIASEVDSLSMYLFSEKFRYDTTVQVADIEARIFAIRRNVIGFPRTQASD